MLRCVAPLFLLIVFDLFLLGHAQAHTRSESFSVWSIENDTVTVVFTTDARRVTQLSVLYPEENDLAALLRRHLKGNIEVRMDGENCPSGNLETLPSSEETVRVKTFFQCASLIDETQLQLTVSAFAGVSPTHLHIARIYTANGMVEYLFTETNKDFNLQTPDQGMSFWRFLKEGYTHVWAGWDHLAFVLALVLVARNARRLIFSITGFTIGHCFSLLLVSTGWLLPNAPLIEALIAFTILFTAFEAAEKYDLPHAISMKLLGAGVFLIGCVTAISMRQSALVTMGLLAVFCIAMSGVKYQLRSTLIPILAIVFGLAHGGGFAGAFASFSVDTEALFWPLLGFNIGVEFAQLVFCGVTVWFLWGIGQYTRYRPYAEIIAICGLILLGCYWFVLRVIS